MSKRVSGPLTAQQLRVLLEDAVDAMVVTDANGHLLYMNSAAGKLYGFEQLQSRSRDSVNLQQYVQEAFTLTGLDGTPVPEEEQPLTQALRGRPCEDLELRIRHNDSDEERVFMFSCAILEGEQVLNALTIRDVTERHKAERRYRIAFETNPAPTVVVQLADLVLLDSNQGFAEMTGIDGEEARGRPLLSLGLLSHGDDLAQVIEQLRAGMVVQLRQTAISRVDQEDRLVMVAARPIEIDGEACGIFTFLDVTELQQAQRQLGESSSELALLNRELDAFSRGVSHDLRTPLRGIEGFSQALLEDYGGQLGEEGRRYLHRVKSGAVRMGELIDSLLLLSRLSRREMTNDHVDLGELAKQIASRLEEESPERQVKVEIESGLLARGDRHMLRLLMTVLLENSWKFTRNTENPRIEVGSRLQDGAVAYEVRDNGDGFDTEFSSKLFEPFQRLHDPKEFEGLGVGLAAAQRIVERHGGRIWAQRQSDGWTSFCFTLEGEGSSTD